MGAARRHGVGAAYQINLAAGALPAQSRRGLDHQMHLLQISRFRIVSMWVHLERLFMNTHRWHAPRKEPLLKIAEMPHHRTAKPARRICTLDSGASSSLEMISLGCIISILVAPGGNRRGDKARLVQFLTCTAPW